MLELDKVETMFGTRYAINVPHLTIAMVLNPPDTVYVHGETIPLPDKIWVNMKQLSSAQDGIKAYIARSERFEEDSSSTESIFREDTHAAMEMSDFKDTLKVARSNSKKELVNILSRHLAETEILKEEKKGEANKIEIKMDNGVIGRLSSNSIEIEYKGLTYSALPEVSTRLVLVDFDYEVAEKEGLLVAESAGGKKMFKGQYNFTNFIVLNASALISAIGFLILEETTKSKRFFKIVLNEVVPIESGDEFKSEKFIEDDIDNATSEQEEDEREEG